MMKTGFVMGFKGIGRKYCDFAFEHTSPTFQSCPYYYSTANMATDIIGKFNMFYYNTNVCIQLIHSYPCTLYLQLKLLYIVMYFLAGLLASLFGS